MYKIENFHQKFKFFNIAKILPKIGYFQYQSWCFDQEQVLRFQIKMAYIIGTHVLHC